MATPSVSTLQGLLSTLTARLLNVPWQELAARLMGAIAEDLATAAAAAAAANAAIAGIATPPWDSGDLATYADLDPVQGVEVVLTMTLGNIGTGFRYVGCTHKMEITSVEVQKRGGAGGAGDSILVADGMGNAITDAIDINKADKTRQYAATIDDAYSTIAAGTNIRITQTDGGAGGNDVSCMVIIRGVLRP